MTFELHNSRSSSSNNKTNNKKWLALIRVTANGVKECAALYFYEQPDTSKTGRGRLEREAKSRESERKGERVRGGIMQAA